MCRESTRDKGSGNLGGFVRSPSWHLRDVTRGIANEDVRQRDLDNRNPLSPPELRSHKRDILRYQFSVDPGAAINAVKIKAPSGVANAAHPERERRQNFNNALFKNIYGRTCLNSPIAQLGRSSSAKQARRRKND